MEFNHTTPIYVQVIRDIEKKMIQGALRLGDKLPSARELAMMYQINPNTSNRIYRELELMELCYTKRGLGTFVTEDKNKLLKVRREMADQVLMEFLGEMKDLEFTEDEIVNEILTKLKPNIEGKGE